MHIPLPALTILPQLPPHLFPQVVQEGLIFAVVSEVRSTLLQGFLDLNLELVIGLLQVPHCLQVAGQPVVQVLHGKLLIAHDVSTVSAGTHLDAAGEAPCARAHPHPSSQPTADARGDADMGPTGPTMDSGGPVDRSRSTDD